MKNPPVGNEVIQNNSQPEKICKNKVWKELRVTHIDLTEHPQIMNIKKKDIPREHSKKCSSGKIIFM